MKNRILLFLLIFLPFSLLAQVPLSINYQGIARVSGGIVANQSISVTIELLSGAGGSPVFQEVHTTTTNAYGVFSIGVGSINSTAFATLLWESIKRIKSTFVYNGQTIVTIDDLHSVPFARYSEQCNWSKNATYAANATNADNATIANNAKSMISGSDILHSAPSHTFQGGPIFAIGWEDRNETFCTWFRRASDGSCRSGNGSQTAVVRFSIVAQDNILAPGFHSTSDKRIKYNFISNNLVKDLKTISQLKVTDYQYKDFIQKGTEQKKGFIAQEVEQVFPEAVTKRVDFIPNIYQIGKNIKTNDTEQTLTITVDSLDDLKVGDKIRLIAKAQNEVEVTAVEGTTFTVKGWTETETKDVFVYGKQVNDFRVVDYDRIFTLNVSATQALIQEVDGLKAQIRALEAQNQALKKSNLALTKKFDSLDSRLTQLEKTAEKAATPTPVNSTSSKAKPKR